jgi:hypothetical protein
VTPTEQLGDEAPQGRERRARTLVHSTATGERSRPPTRPAPGFDAEGMAPAVMDALELELRQLDGVGYVSFPQRQARTLIGIALQPGADPAEVRVEAHRLAVRHLEGPIEVEIMGEERPPVIRRSGMRVRLLLSLRPHGDDRVELHLAQGDRRAVVEASGSDPVGVASQVLRALNELGYPSPFVVETVHDLSPELGSGSLVVLRHPLTGQRRRGLANGSTTAEAHARAVLNALNRYLQPSAQDD